ncbi:MAG: lysophospholipid acyltransferase family protein [Roseiflexaceae bacterium]|nr:lysophospholipid acyltransferase family protein [Roseiflexaceae bacterium]
MADYPLPAIPANHNRLGEELVARLLIEWPLRQQFSRVWLKIEGPLPTPADGPLICYMNHSSWWDGYVALLLHRAVFRRSFEAYLMMSEAQLRRFRFFTWLGVFSVSRADKQTAARSLAYAAGKLAERRDRYLWMFPEGKLTPIERRPLQLYPGVARIAHQAGGALLWPVALRYEFRGEEKPELFIRCGPGRAAAAATPEHEILDRATADLTTAVDCLRDDYTEQRFAGYRLLQRGAPGINHIGDALFAAIRPRRTDRSARPPR